MSFIATRKAKSDYINSNVENCKNTITHIRYIDGNNFYGSQMLFDLTTEEYKFEDKMFMEMFEKIKNDKPIDTNKRGIFLKVDLYYPKVTHKLHKEFHLAPGHYKVTYNKLSAIN